jgi:UDP-glucose 4-epimerase
MNMRILITGGAGFIGSHLADRLLASGDHVLVIDNFATGQRENLADHPHLELVEGSISDRDLVERAFARFAPELVVHAAASYKDPDNWHEDSLTNVLGSTIVVQASQRHGVRRLVYLQTSLCYGLKPREHPITLDHPVHPEGSSYAVSKTCAESYIALSGLDYVSFRLANAYGPRNLSGPLPTFYHRLKQGKSCFVADTRRDFIFVEDLVDCVMLALQGHGRCGPYHVSSGSDIAIGDLFEMTVQCLGITLDEPVEVRPRGDDDPYTILLDPSVTIQDLGWRATTSLAQGVRAAIGYYDRFGITRSFTHLRQGTG